MLAGSRRGDRERSRPRRAYASALAAAAVNDADDDFDLVVGSHLRGTFTCGRAAAAQFREQGGGGRLAIWSHPVEVVSVLKDGGWDVDGIADLLPGTLRDHHQEFRPAPLPIPAVEGTKQ